jgi:hypothetical protein
MDRMTKDYLFVCGCARSGTSITTELLRSHPKIAIGRERYNSLFKTNSQSFNSALFERLRFCQELLDTDTHHRQLDSYYSRVLANWNQYQYIGDKVPSLFKQYDVLMSGFFTPKILFLLRNIFDVSQSWEMRRKESIANNGPWEHDKGYEAAIDEWNISLSNTLRAMEDYPDNILVVSYETLFSDQKSLKRIFDFVNLEPTAEVVEYWQASALKSQELENARIIHMPSAIKDAILLRADFDAYRALKSKIVR